MQDLIAVVTGANAGLGYHTTLKLARRGMTVVMACRSAERAEKARSELLAAIALEARRSQNQITA